MGATARGAAQAAVRMLDLSNRLLLPLADNYGHQYDLTRILDGPVCGAARRMFHYIRRETHLPLRP
eukprot:6236325-Prymnesium_polylepis.1